MLVAALALALMQQKPSLVSEDRGEVLYKACLSSVKVMDFDSPTHQDGTQSEYCRGYVEAFLDVFDRKAAGICIPEDVRLSTVVRVYVAYMQKYPTMFEKPKGLGLGSALAIAYPCPKK